MIGKIAIGSLIFAFTFLAGIALRDTGYERYIQANKHRVKVGMSEAEVIAILGQPTSQAMSDTPGLYWCYGSDSWQIFDYGETYCGNTILEMSRDGHVVSTPR